MTTRKDTQRIIDLYEQGRTAGDVPEAVIWRVITQMPHVPITGILQVMGVHAEECLLDASIRRAQVEAGRQIDNIIREIHQREGSAQLTPEEACVLLRIRAQDGDKRALELVDEFNKAMLVIDLDGEGAES